MRKTIINFPKQFLFEPKIENGGKLKLHKFSKFIVTGMGGSHLSSDLVRAWKPAINMAIHSDYGLPAINTHDKRNTLIVASSYSGNTEETIDAFRTAVRNKIPAAVVATGGKLLELAQKYRVPYIKLPDAGIQPRMAAGLGFRALLKIIGEEKALMKSAKLAYLLKPLKFENQGRNLAKKIKGFVPVIYSSQKNSAIAYNWKIKFNETGKIPAFYNILPELNHNEMTGFDVKPGTKNLSKGFYFIFLSDIEDNSRVLKRMNVLKRLYNSRGLRVEFVFLKGAAKFNKIFSSLILADWTAYYTALGYGSDPEQAPMVVEFKKLILV